MFAMPAGTSMNFDPSVVPQQHVLTSKVLQKPMSKVAYLNSTPELLQFPDFEGVGSQGVGIGSQVNPEFVDRELAVLWLEHSDLLAKQVSRLPMVADTD